MSVLTALACLRALAVHTAGPASGANTVTDNNNGSVTVDFTSTNSNVYACSGSPSVTDCQWNVTSDYQWGSTAVGAPLTGTSLLVAGGSSTSTGLAATTLPAGTYTIVMWPGGIRANRVGVVGVTLIGASTPASPPTATRTSSPESIVQQIGMPSSGNCASVTDSSLQYGTGLSGGWTKSWAQWPNSGSGGIVCTRTLVFNNRWQLS